ncbi:MAG: hypothetical protein RL653_2389 [Pseudomonadota bacterium]|jgi:transcriptional regulator with XRE-family HTH domain
MLRDEDRELARAIGGRARALRAMRGITQEQVAEEVSLSPQVYSRLEQGRVLPSIRTLMRLAEVLHASPGHLLDADPPPMREEQPLMKVTEDAPRRGRPKGPRSPAVHELAAIGRYAEKLDASNRKLVLELTRRLSGSSLPKS